jgi:hypothetical protein
MTTVQYVIDQIAVRFESPEFQRTNAQMPRTFLARGKSAW